MGLTRARRKANERLLGLTPVKRTDPGEWPRRLGVLDRVSTAIAARRVSRRAESANRCLIFLRDVCSELLYTQMKGRRCRTNDLYQSPEDKYNGDGRSNFDQGCVWRHGK